MLKKKKAAKQASKQTTKSQLETETLEKKICSFIHSTCMGSFVYLLELDLIAIKRTTVPGLTELSLKDTDGKTGNYTTQQSCMGGRTGLYSVQRRSRFLNSLEF